MFGSISGEVVNDLSRHWVKRRLHSLGTRQKSMMIFPIIGVIDRGRNRVLDEFFDGVRVPLNCGVKGVIGGCGRRKKGRLISGSDADEISRPPMYRGGWKRRLSMMVSSLV